MFRISLLAVVVVIFIGLSCDVYAQDAGQTTRELVAALDKTKYKKKEKANISIEIYIDIKNEAVVRDAIDYAGRYESEESGSGHRLTLQVERGGVVSGNGYDTMHEGDRRLSFTLKGASISGALLTATKVYETGEERKLEAVFVNRTVSQGKNVNEIASRDTKFGLGFLEQGTWSDPQNRTMNYTSRIFLERR